MLFHGPWLTEIFFNHQFDLAVYRGGRRPKDDSHHVEGLWGIPWSEYVDLGKKSPALPLREQFGLHLLQIHSITGAKARDIVSVFPTPRGSVIYLFHHHMFY